MTYAVMNNNGSFVLLGRRDQEGTRQVKETPHVKFATKFTDPRTALDWAVTTNRYKADKTWVAVSIKQKTKGTEL